MRSSKNLGVAASDIHLGETPARLRSKRTPLADYSIVYFVIHGLVPDVKGLVLSLPNSRPSLTKACSPRAKSRSCSSTPMSACNTRGRRASIFSIVRRNNFKASRQRRMVAQPRRQTSEKRCSKRLIQINRAGANKPNRVDRLGKPGVHQY